MVVVTLVCVGVLLALIATDVIRLGPSTTVLNTDALVVSGSRYRIPDGDALFDYYGFLVTLTNQERDPSLRPYAVEVNVTIEDGEVLGGWWPQAGNRASQGSVTLPTSDGEGQMTVRLPAGVVRTHTGGDYFVWSVRGERGLSSQPVFLTTADFYLQAVRIPENATLIAHLEAVVDWYYVNPLQTDPAATKGGLATCFFVPPSDPEDPSAYGACE